MSSNDTDETHSPIRFKARINNEYTFLSNFYPYVKNFSSSTPQPDEAIYLFQADDMGFHSVEQYYQYKKYLVIDESYANSVIMPTITAEEVKKVSGKGYYVNYQHTKLAGSTTKASLNRTFDQRKREFISDSGLSVMRAGLYYKFARNSELKAALLATYPRPLSEVGRMKRDYWAHTGQDMLGKLLMELRTQLQTDS